MRFKTLHCNTSFFVQDLKWKPNSDEIWFLLATDKTISTLLTNSQVLYVDGTFDITEIKLVLTTILVKIQGVGFPVVWFLHNQRTTTMYAEMWNALKVISKTIYLFKGTYKRKVATECNLV